MNMIYKFSGSSDDIICYETQDAEGNRVSADELNADGANIVLGREEAVEGKDAEGIRIKFRYVKGGVWAATIEPIAEDVKCPYVVVAYVEKYTTVIQVMCPDDTPFSWKKVRVTSH